jgi:hypothetical protein
MSAPVITARRLKSALYSCCILFMFPASTLSAEYSAEEIMRRVDEREAGDSSVSDITLVLIDRRERQRIRNLKLYSKNYGEDTKTLSLFESPADIRGTAYLNFDWNDSLRDDDSWLYLPALQRVKRLASSDTSDSFLGSDFTYADINGFEIDWYDYSFVNESEMIGGEDCWVIEMIAKSEFKDRAEEATGYSKIQSWVSKEKFIQLRGQFWELRGNRIKFFTASEVELVEDIWTVKRLQAITTRNDRQEHASILQIKSIDYNVDVADELLTTQAMQRGFD